MEYAKLTFDEDGTPVSNLYADVYFSQGQGKAETHHVFINPNQLIERFQLLGKHEHFTIAETGFGTGLNFFIVSELFMQHAPKTARLHFISCEKYPINPTDLDRILQPWEEFSAYTTLLLKQYPPALSGYHTLEFDRIELLLMLGDALKMYSELTADVDAWFLDGFSPSRNPEMWQPDLFNHVARLSKPNSTFSTFTSARHVRDALAAVGFELTKKSGFGLKREMLTGLFIGAIGPNLPKGWPSSELPSTLPLSKKALKTGKRVAIIGAGIAGATTALELSKRGYSVTVYEREHTPAQGGSGNAQGAVYAKLSASLNTATQFYSQALLLAQRRLNDCSNQVEHGVSGLVQLAHNEKENDRLTDLKNSNDIPRALVSVLSATELSQKLGITVSDNGAWFEQGGWVNPSQWVTDLLAQSACEVVCKTHIQSITQVNNEWVLKSQGNKRFIADHVVLTTATDTLAFEQTTHLPLKPIAGQITKIVNAEAQKLNAIICTDRYIMPAVNGVSIIGSTFRLKSTDTQVTDADHAENVASLSNRVPALNNSTTEIIGGRSGVRCTTKDYLPLVGGIVEPTAFAEQFHLPIQRKTTHREKPAQLISGLWLNTGHGSKGLCSSHLSAKIIAAMIAGEPLPVQASVQQNLNPNRFLVRDLLRETRQKKSR